MKELLGLYLGSMGLYNLSAGLAMRICAKTSGHYSGVKKCVSIHEMRPPLSFHPDFEGEYKFFVIIIIGSILIALKGIFLLNPRPQISAKWRYCIIIACADHRTLSISFVYPIFERIIDNYYYWQGFCTNFVQIDQNHCNLT